MGERPTIAVGGSVAQRPHRGGHTWVFLQYLLGFRRLGWDVVFLDRLEPEMCVDASGAPTAVEKSANLRYLEAVMERYGLTGRWALFADAGGTVLGMDRTDLLTRLRDSALLLNVMGFVDDPEVLAVVPRRVFLDIDPGFGQMWRALGLHDLFSGHHDYVTIGENIGRPDCSIPACGLDWVTTKQPVVLDHWTFDDHPGERFTSVGAWRGPFGPIDFEGRTYGLRVHEFRRLVELPARTGAPFEVALDIEPADHRDRQLLDSHGWRIADPTVVAADPWSYQDYVRRSHAELMVAKNMYVQARSGWFSDRSICYLATGRPVVAQDTGLGGLVPTGQGLLTFSTVDEAADAVSAVSGDWPRHARAARAIAEEHFNSDRVLGSLLARLGVA
ncbi:MAG: hypothetical protein M3179_15285 [Actinomycetota bacterium]|nr:hypothetical protein [Actinomycetota bacterium]